MTTPNQPHDDENSLFELDDEEEGYCVKFIQGLRLKKVEKGRFELQILFQWEGTEHEKCPNWERFVEEESGTYQKLLTSFKKQLSAFTKHYRPLINAIVQHRQELEVHLRNNIAIFGTNGGEKDRFYSWSMHDFECGQFDYSKYINLKFDNKSLKNKTKKDNNETERANELIEVILSLRSDTAESTTDDETEEAVAKRMKLQEIDEFAFYQEIVNKLNSPKVFVGCSKRCISFNEACEQFFDQKEKVLNHSVGNLRRKFRWLFCAAVHQKVNKLKSNIEKLHDFFFTKVIEAHTAEKHKIYVTAKVPTTIVELYWQCNLCHADLKTMSKISLTRTELIKICRNNPTIEPALIYFRSFVNPADQ